MIPLKHMFVLLACLGVLCDANPAAAGNMTYGGPEYRKAKLICTICDDMVRLDTGIRPPRSGGFTNKKLEDDQMRYRIAYGEFFPVKRCKERETKDLCRTYRSVEEKGRGKKKH